VSEEFWRWVLRELLGPCNEPPLDCARRLAGSWLEVRGQSSSSSADFEEWLLF